MNMLLWTTDVDSSHLSIIEDIKRTGFDGVEIPIGGGDKEHYRQLGKLISDLELGCTSVTSLFEDGNPASSDPAIRAKALEQLKWRIDMGAELGAEVIGGPFHSAFAYFSGNPPTIEERKHSTEVLQKAAEYASQAGIMLTPEALNRFECYLYNTLDEISALIREIDHPNLRMIFDTHHAHIEEKSMRDVIQRHKDIIAHVHISENDRGTPGTGQVAWDEVFSNLYDVGYDGWLTIEAFSRNNPVFASGINVWRNFAPTLDEVYRDGYAFIRKMCDKHSQSAQ